MKVFFAAAFLIIGSMSGTASGFEGPLQVRNQFPLLLGIDPPYLESAEPKNMVTLSLYHSSTYLMRDMPLWTFHIDIEMTELDLRVKKRIGDLSEVGLDIPVIRPTGGFFDSPLADWHAMLPFGDYGRHNRPYNSFLYEVSYNGAPVITGVNDRIGLGDLRLTYKRVIVQEMTTVSALANIELPTGDAKTGYGNGSYDFSAALLADFRWSETYRGYANAGWIFPGDLKGYQTIPLHPAAYGGFAVEAAWWERFSMIAQTVVQQSPFHRTDTRHVDWPGILFTFGGRYHGRKSNIDLSLTEDPDTAGAPDFIANITWTTYW